MTQSPRLITFILMGILGIFAVPVSQANFEELVSSTVMGGNPYLLVIYDPQGASQRSPGIYVRNGSDWDMAVGGRFLQVPVRGGLSQQLDITKVTNRFESMAVVDGRLSLFTVRSRADSPLSVGTFGIGAFEVINPLDQSPVELPLIEDLKDVSIFAHEQVFDGISYQVVLVSLRRPSSKGDGITFALVLNPADNRGDEIRPLYKPVLLDWKFADTQELTERLFSGMGFSSLNIISHLVRPLVLSQQEPGPLSNWRRFINLVLTGQRSPSHFVMSERKTYPYIHLLTGTLQIDSLPYASLQTRQFNAIAIFDPISRRHGIYGDRQSLSSSEIEVVQPLISGAVNCDSDNCAEIGMVRLPERQAALVRMRDGRIFAVTQALPSEALDTVQIKPTDSRFLGKIPDQVSWFTMNSTRTLLVSWKFGDVSFTSAYEIENSYNNLRVSRSVQLCPEFYTAELLEARSSVSANTPIFDAFTPLQNDQPYITLHRDTAPHIDVAGSLNRNATKYIFPAPIERRAVTSSLEYRVYENHQGFHQQTGLYAGKGSDAAAVVNAEVIQPAIVSNEEGVLERVTHQFPPLGAIELNLFIADVMFRQGKSSKGANILALATSEQAPKAPVYQYLLRNGFDPEKLKYFQLVRPQNLPADVPRDTESIPYLAVMGLQGGPTKALSFRIQKDRDGKILFTGLVERNLSESGISLDETLSRLRFDERNSPFWVETPEVEDNDNQYRLTRMSDGVAVEPNRGIVRIRFRGVAQPNESSQAAPKLNNSWRIYSFDKRYQENLARIRHASEYQTDVFPQFKGLLDDLANPAKPAQHVVLLVPPELKGYAENYPLVLRVRDENRPSHWAENFHGFHFYQIDASRADQEQVMTNLSSMREESENSRGVRAVLYSPITTVKQAARPKLLSQNGEIVGFRIGERRLGSQTVAVAGNNTNDGGATEIREAPALTYLVATEGQRIELSSFRDRTSAPTFSSLFVGTEEEWASLLTDASLEQRYGLAEHFQVIRLAPPTREIRENYVLNLLHRTEIQNLGYQISLENLVQGQAARTMTVDGAQLQIAQYLVNRAESLCNRNHTAVFDGFMKVLNLLGYELTNNPRVRNARVIDRSVVEGVLAKVFSMPLNINLLPKDDPLQILHRHETGQQPGEEAAFQWVQAGYYGPLSLKMEIIQTILNQLTSDEVRSVASAMIVYGETGSGKTSLITTLFKVLGIKSYRISGTPETNADAWSFFLPMRMVYDDGPAVNNTVKTAGMMSLSEAMQHLDRFLASPNGYRGFIILDDIHLAPPNVKARFLSRIRGLIENSTYTAVDANGRSVEYPTRNLTPILTMNPTDNRERISKFTERGKEPTDMDIIAATLSNSDGSNDEIRSLLARFARIVNLSKFPAEAKAPKLTVTTRRALQDILENDGRFAVVSPAAIQAMVTAFPQMDARNFLSTATRSLTQPIKNFPGAMFAVVPYHRSELEPADGAEGQAAGFGVSGSSAQADVEAFARRHIQVVPVDAEGSYRGQIEFLKYVLDNFRKHAFELALLGINHDARFAKGARSQQYFAAPFAQAVYRHLLASPAIPLDQMNLEPRDFGVHNNNERDQFRRILDAEISNQQASQARLPAIGMAVPTNLYAVFAGSGGATHSRTRQHVLRDYTDRLSNILEQALKEMLHLPGLNQLPEADLWLRGLPTRDPQLVETLGAALMDQLGKFINDINNRALVENRDQSPEMRLSQYDTMRLFAMVFDKAISRLPWSRVSNFLIEAQSRATRNMALGQSPGVQHFLFESRTSPMISFDVSLVLMLAQSMPFFADKAEEQQHQRFTTNCERLLGGKGNP